MPRLDRADVTYSSSPSMELPERLPGVSVPPLTVTLTTDTPNSSDAADLWPNFWAPHIEPSTDIRSTPAFGRSGHSLTSPEQSLTRSGHPADATRRTQVQRDRLLLRRSVAVQKSASISRQVRNADF